ncbi:MAG: M20 family metallopeptidase [Acidobacteria bacterium]|nr:M20 family metallopeptidase [Acidobacteriota bacterium]
MAYSPVVQTLADLIRINSVNPAYPNGRPELEIQRYILDFFESRGIEVWKQEVLPDRPNVIALAPGQSKSGKIIFEAHVDTAGVEDMIVPPFEPAVSNGRMYGRGACDTKAGLAAMMHAVADLKVSGQNPVCDVWVVAAADEEHSYRGVAKLCENIQASAAVVAEPTEMKIAIASKGCVRFRITTRGKSAHSSEPHLGANAIEHMARVIDTLAEYAKRMRALSHPLVGSPTLNVGLIEGGTQVNVVPEFCWIEIDRRLVPGEQASSALDDIKKQLQELRGADHDLEVIVEPAVLQDWPLETPANSPIVLQASQSLRDAGLDPQPVGVPFGSDASKFSMAGVPSIVMGPGSIAQAHTEDEFVDLDQVEKAFEVYRRLMTTFQ